MINSLIAQIEKPLWCIGYARHLALFFFFLPLLLSFSLCHCGHEVCQNTHTHMFVNPTRTLSNSLTTLLES